MVSETLASKFSCLANVLKRAPPVVALSMCKLTQGQGEGRCQTQSRPPMQVVADYRAEYILSANNITPATVDLL